MMLRSPNTRSVALFSSSVGSANDQAIDTWNASPTFLSPCSSAHRYSSGCPNLLATPLHRRSSSVSSGFGFFSSPSPSPSPDPAGAAHGQLRTRTTRNDRPLSPVRCHSTGPQRSGANPTPAPGSAPRTPRRNASLSACASASGRDRLMCSGSGAPRSLTSKLVTSVPSSPPPSPPPSPGTGTGTGTGMLPVAPRRCRHSSRSRATSPASSACTSPGGCHSM
ncbi:hypothetical protein VTK26DRAFT_9519 [Humicola hyalothermophila]